MRFVVPLVLASLAGGCAGTDWTRNVYEGIRQQRSVEATGDVKTTPAMPDYDRYQRERATLLGAEPEKRTQ